MTPEKLVPDEEENVEPASLTAEDEYGQPDTESFDVVAIEEVHAPLIDGLLSRL